MTLAGLLAAAPLLVCWFFLSAAEDAATGGGSSATPPPPPPPAASNSSGSNSTQGGGKPDRGSMGGLNVDSSMIQRALYVLIGITMIGVLYFLVRAVRLKKPSQKKKYGLLSNYDESVEMDAMESDEDDTLYEARSLRR